MTILEIVLTVLLLIYASGVYMWIYIECANDETVKHVRWMVLLAFILFPIAFPVALVKSIIKRR